MFRIRVPETGGNVNPGIEKLAALAVADLREQLNQLGGQMERRERARCAKLYAEGIAAIVGASHGATKSAPMAEVDVAMAQMFAEGIVEKLRERKGFGAVLDQYIYPELVRDIATQIRTDWVRAQKFDAENPEGS